MVVHLTINGEEITVKHVKGIEETGLSLNGLGKITVKQYGVAVGREYVNVSSVLCIPTVL